MHPGGPLLRYTAEEASEVIANRERLSFAGASGYYAGSCRCGAVLLLGLGSGQACGTPPSSAVSLQQGAWVHQTL